MAKELEKWNRYYAALPLDGAEDEPTRLFHEELAGLVQALLPEGGRILEAGCGAGRHSLALARLGHYEIDLLDFSSEALRHARRLFEREGLEARFIEGSAHEPGEAEYDLVFNAGVLEHHDLEGQTLILRGMASRSRRYVLALVPNRLCYWYWLWRVHLASNEGWPYGFEAPLADLTASFEAAGLRALGHRFVGAAWTESLISGISGLDEETRRQFLSIHRSAVIPLEQRSYLLAALGSVPGAEVADPPPGWESLRLLPENVELASAQALLSDILPAKLGHERKLGPESIEPMNDWLAHAKQAMESLEIAQRQSTDLERRLGTADSEIHRALADLDSFRLSRAYKVGRLIGRLRRDAIGTAAVSLQWLAGRYREEGLLRALNAEDPLKNVAIGLQCAARVTHLEGAPVPVAGPSLANGPHRWLRFRHPRALALAAKEKISRRVRRRATRRQLEQILADNRGRPLVVFPPFIDWNLPLFQRPQHIAQQLAARGYLYFFCTPNAGYDSVSGFQKVRDGLYLTDEYELLLELEEPKTLHLYSTDLVVAGTPYPRTSAFVADQLGRGSSVLYEYIDELHPSISGAPIPHEVLEKHESLLCDERVALVASANKLLADVERKRSANYALVTNGVEFEHFSRGFDRAEAPPEIEPLLARGQPVVGYFGALAAWFDFELVLALARKRSCQLLLVGWDYDGSAARYHLDRHDNIHVLGPINYQHLPRYAHWFDVSTIPFRINEVTESTSPIKLFEYMALGKPIVTTDMPECRKYRSVLIGKDHEDFIRKVDEALALRGDEAYARLLRNEALANTWEAKAARIAELLPSPAATRAVARKAS